MLASQMQLSFAHISSNSACTCRRSCQPPRNGLRAAQSTPVQRQRGNSGSIVRRQRLSCRAAEQEGADESPGAPEQQDPTVSVSSIDLNKEVSKFATKTATTFAPRASGKQNPAYKGSILYSVFEYQAYASILIGGLLSFNVLFPSNEPDIARLLGMWSTWIFAIPSLRARDCSKAEKDALNLLFIGVPLLNVTLPLLWKSFPFIFSADVVAMAGIYAWKVWLPAAGEEES